MSLELDPTELGFKRECLFTKGVSGVKGRLLIAAITGPFTVEVSQTLRLRNTNQDPVSFKVREPASE
jgi:hypothetical protein